MTTKTIPFTLLAAFVLLSTAARADEAVAPPPAPAPRRWWIGGKLGYLMSGSVYLSEADSTFASDAGPAAQLELDASVAERLAFGGFLFVARSGLEGEVDATVLTAGAAIKARFPIGRLELRPGVTLGYQTISGDAFDRSSSKGFDVGATVELAIPFSLRTDFLVEVGFISQPAGGNEDTDVTFGPIFYLSAGASFGG